jgi:hypothetical protein
VNDDPTDPAAPRIPKYKAPDFMRKEIELFLRARNETVLMRRNGDDDAPIRPIAPLQGIHAVRPVREINRTIR